MRHRAVLLAPLLVVAACRGAPVQMTPTPGADILDARTGQPITLDELRKRLRDADVAYLGEVHDNPDAHRLRAMLIAGAPGKGPALVYEHFPAARDSVLAAAPGADTTAWLDRAGFDRKGWRWPVHAPIIDAALRRELPRYGSLLEREVLRPVMRGAPVPEPMAGLMARVPLDSAAAAALDQTLIDGHCGALQPGMAAPLRLAQAARDASMADAILRALGTGRPVWLLAGNGHVRRDYGAPRFLTALRPQARSLSIGFLERSSEGWLPPAAERAVYDVVWMIPPAPREDPCAAFRKPGG